jgi:iron complex outermembrane receptor protein
MRFESRCASFCPLIVASCLGALPAFPANDPDPIADSLAEVIVTGSRIPTTYADATMPVTVLDAADLARGGYDSIGKVLQTLPMSASTVPNTNLNNGGDGATRADLRSLEPKRTLVLLNGHRFPNGGIGGDNSVDLDTLPTGLIDHVEVLTSGASAIYGADAVAGVINFIIKPSFNGVDASVLESQTDRDDGRISTLKLSAGHEVFGGQWMAGAEFVRQRGVLQSQRSYSAVPETISDAAGDLAAVGSQTLPQGLFDVPDGNALGLPAGEYTHVNGTIGRTASDYRPWNPATDLFNYEPYQYLQTPNERSSIWVIGTQPVSSGVSLHFEGLFNHRTSSQLLAPTPFSAGLDPSPTLADGSEGIPANNYYNPFGVDITGANRRFVELPDRSYNERVDMNRELVSLQFELGSWRLEPAFSYSHSNAAEIDSGAIAGQRLVGALGPSGLNAQGQVVCGTPDASGIVSSASTIAGCVPVDIFGGVGSLTPQQITYLAQTLEDHGTNLERIADIDAQGPLGRVWGGPVLWGVGGEYRSESGSFLLDPNAGGGAVGSGGQNDIPEVGYSAREAYAEMRAPLARDQPFAHAADLSVGARYSDFSSFGSHFTWQTGLRWEPLESVALRSNYARVFREPALTELYVSQGTTFDLEFDPCGNNPTPGQKAHCAANGVPGGSYVQSFNSFFLIQQGGNPNLQPESGNSFDSGIEIRPPALPGLLATLDAYRINLNGSIENPSDESVLQECADGGRTDICGLIRRYPDGTIAEISSIPRNLGDTLVSGLDAALTWQTAPSFGRLKFSLQASYLARHDTQLFPGGTVIHEAGTYSQLGQALPRWRSLTHVDFDRGSWHLSYSTQWIDGYAECNFVEFQEDPYCRRVAGVLYQDIEGAFILRNALTFRLGINNLTNRQPPFLNFGNEANTDTLTYRLLGRTFFAGIRWRVP